jgi:hypothetical protein
MLTQPQMREFDRCRKLYEQFLKSSPQNAYAWIKFAELETLLDDVDRARALYDLAVQQPVLDMPELLWKSYIDFETSQGEFKRVRALYRQLTEKSAHPKVFMSLAEFEMSVLEDRLREEDEENTDGMQRSRRVLEDGYAVIKDKGDNEHVCSFYTKQLLSFSVESCWSCGLRLKIATPRPTLCRRSSKCFAISFRNKLKSAAESTMS